MDPAANVPTSGAGTKANLPPKKEVGGCGKLLRCSFLAGLLLAALLVAGVCRRVWVILPFLRAEPSLPSFAPAGQSERWALNEKLGRIASGATQLRLELTPGELNALLARFSPLPTMGFVPSRCRALVQKDSVIVAFEGSGFWLRSLTLVTEWGLQDGKTTFKRVIFNKWQPAQPWMKSGTQWYVERYLQTVAPFSVDGILPTGYTMKREQDHIILAGPLPLPRRGRS